MGVSHQDMSIVFGDTYAIGDYVVGNAEGLVLSEGGGNNGDSDAGGDPKELDEHHIHEKVFIAGASFTPVREKHELDRTPNSKRRRKSNIFDVFSTSKALQEMIKVRTCQSTSGSVTSHPITYRPILHWSSGWRPKWHVRLGPKSLQQNYEPSML
ncbi:uncharacterized protein LOC115741971 [Rhodamnia argentea]|uniref:Uncharacterized protein LOC115741971 n=1 Tax=Rhodamnia argentea TaxID=178133 RepID=A0ABM3HEE0_9MYRT|nr:uncharacterized protein LOC115741971 [Rhodamnia argentea]